MRNKECCTSNFALFWESFDFLNSFKINMITFADSSKPWSGGPAPVALVSGPTLVAQARTSLTATQQLLLPLGVVVFDWLFWREKGGLNMPFFSFFVVVAQLVQLPRHATALRSGYFWLMMAGTLFSGAMMAVYGSVAAALACVASGLLLVAGDWEVLMAHHNLQPCFRCADIGFLLDMPGPPRGAHSGAPAHDQRQLRHGHHHQRP